MTDPDRRMLRELLAAATPGPWEVPESIHGDPYITEQGRGFLRGGGIATCDRRDDYGRSNAALIVAAVNALPALLDDLDARDKPRAEWYADRDPDAGHFEWQPVLIESATNVVVTSARTWFETEADCVGFIRDYLVGAGLDRDLPAEP